MKNLSILKKEVILEEEIQGDIAVKSSTRSKLVKDVDRVIWRNLKAISAIKDISIAETLKEIITYYIKHTGIK